MDWDASSQGVFVVLGIIHAILPSQAGLALELALEFPHGVLQGAGAEDLVLSAIANATPSRPGSTMIVGSD